jgi:hypothetical protein
VRWPLEIRKVLCVVLEKDCRPLSHIGHTVFAPSLSLSSICVTPRNKKENSSRQGPFTNRHTKLTRHHQGCSDCKDNDVQRARQPRTAHPIQERRPPSPYPPRPAGFEKLVKMTDLWAPSSHTQSVPGRSRRRESAEYPARFAKLDRSRSRAPSQPRCQTRRGWTGQEFRALMLRTF